MGISINAPFFKMTVSDVYLLYLHKIPSISKDHSQHTPAPAVRFNTCRKHAAPPFLLELLHADIRGGRGAVFAASAGKYMQEEIKTYALPLLFSTCLNTHRRGCGIHLQCKPARILFSRLSSVYLCGLLIHKSMVLRLIQQVSIFGIFCFCALFP